MHSSNPDGITKREASRFPFLISGVLCGVDRLEALLHNYEVDRFSYLCEQNLIR